MFAVSSSSSTCSFRATSSPRSRVLRSAFFPRRAPAFLPPQPLRNPVNTSIIGRCTAFGMDRRPPASQPGDNVTHNSAPNAPIHRSRAVTDERSHPAASNCDPPIDIVGGAQTATRSSSRRTSSPAWAKSYVFGRGSSRSDDAVTQSSAPNAPIHRSRAVTDERSHPAASNCDPPIDIVSGAQTATRSSSRRTSSPAWAKDYVFGRGSSRSDDARHRRQQGRGGDGGRQVVAAVLPLCSSVLGVHGRGGEDNADDDYDEGAEDANGSRPDRGGQEHISARRQRHQRRGPPAPVPWEQYVRTNAPISATFSWLFIPLILDVIGVHHHRGFTRPDWWHFWVDAYRPILEPLIPDIHDIDLLEGGRYISRDDQEWLLEHRILSASRLNRYGREARALVLAVRANNVQPASALPGLADITRMPATDGEDWAMQADLYADARAENGQCRLRSTPTRLLLHPGAAYAAGVLFIVLRRPA